MNVAFKNMMLLCYYVVVDTSPLLMLLLCIQVSRVGAGGTRTTVPTVVRTPFDQPNRRGAEGEELAQNKRQKVMKMTKITAYGKLFGKVKHILEDCVFHPTYDGQLGDWERLLEEFVNNVKSKEHEQTAGRWDD